MDLAQQNGPTSVEALFFTKKNSTCTLVDEVELLQVIGRQTSMGITSTYLTSLIVGEVNG